MTDDFEAIEAQLAQVGEIADPEGLSVLVGAVRVLVEHNLAHSRERSLVLTKLDEAQLWLGRTEINLDPQVGGNE